MAYRNFVREANLAALQNAVRDKKKLMAAYNQCAQQFWSYCGIAHFMAHEEYLKVYDYYDEHKHNSIVGSVKRTFKECDKEFKRYDDFLSEHMEKNAFYLLTDFHNSVYNGLKKEILDLYLTFKFLFERAGLDDIENKAQVTVASSFISMAADLWHNYFDMYKSKFVIDFSKDFQFANLDTADRFFTSFAEDVCRYKKNKLKPTENYASKQAFDAICTKMVNDDFLDANGYKALKWNHYDEAVNEIERNKMGIDRLREKYKVK